MSNNFAPQEVYNGGYSDAKDIHVRIYNGAAGQAGLIRVWADEFIKYCVKNGSKPFCVAWYLGDTTESIGFLAAGSIDIAITYNEAAEKQALDSGAAVDRKYGFRDHFYLVGPKSDPAGLSKDKTASVHAMFNKIVSSGNADIAVPPKSRPSTRFLSQFDKSATNVKESELFSAIGQAPWALAYSKWYHQYPRYPLQSLEAASLLSEYTLTDRGIWLSSSPSVLSALQLYKSGTDNPKDPLLDPAHLLLGAKVNPKYKKVCEDFMKWVVSKDGGQKVVKEFNKNGHPYYMPAP